MPWQTLGINSLERCLVLINRFWPMQVLANKLGSITFTSNVVRTQLKSSAACIMFSVTDPDPRTITETGRRACRVWMRLNLEGFSVQPLSLAPLLNFYNALGTLPLIDKKAKRDVEKFGETFAEVFNLGGEDLTAWMFRTGLPQEQPLSIPSPRMSATKASL